MQRLPSFLVLFKKGNKMKTNIHEYYEEREIYEGDWFKSEGRANPFTIVWYNNEETITDFNLFTKK